MPRYLAPAGAPIRLTDLARWGFTAMSRLDASAALRAEIRERFGVGHAFLTSTGRAGMTLLLRAMRRLAPAERDEVIVPAYTCYSVAASVVKAGLRPRIVDISPATLDFAPDELARADTSRALAIVATNLYGLPGDLPALAAYARDRRIFLVDDAAQAMGASVGGRACGTWGDAGIFSFDKGKNVSAIDGGVVVTSSDDLAAALDREMAGLPRPGPAQTGLDVMKVLAYFAMLRPWLYGIPARMPQLGLGRTVYTTAFPLARPDPVLSALGLIMLGRLDEFTRIRTANAGALLEGLRHVSGVDVIEPLAGATAAYLRLPVLLGGAAERDRARRALTAAGIGATGSYPASLADVPELRDAVANPDARASGGRWVAGRILTLPTHPFVNAADVVRVVTEFQPGGAAACAA